MINYANEWIKRYKARTAPENKGYEEEAAARDYDNFKAIWDDGNKRAADFPVNGEMNVLDIGAGPGILAIPLAKRVKAVKVIEPSKAMRNLLKKHMQEEKLTNISIINKRFENVAQNEIEKHDIVIASYSLSMRDISSALIKMNNLARKKVYLYWFCGTATWEKIKIDLYPLVYGKEFFEQPKSDIIYGVLCELGISATIRHLEGTSFCREYPTMEDAVLNMRTRLGVQSDTFDKDFEGYIHSHYINEGNKKWIFNDKTNYVEISFSPIQLAEGN